EVIVEDEGPIGRAALASEPNAESTNLETR
ncbi:MAG: hypothetical protein ACI8PT_001156, partial [Gammaproteobacteria bacterium]